MDDYIWKENLSTARSSLNWIWRWPASKAMGSSQQAFIVLLLGGGPRSSVSMQLSFLSSALTLNPISLCERNAVTSFTGSAGDKPAHTQY